MAPKLQKILHGLLCVTMLVGGLSLAISLPVAAQDSAGGKAINNLNVAQESATGTTENPELGEVVANIISIALSLVGIVFIGIIIYGGYLWGTARGSEDKVEQGRRLIFEATVGIIIVLGAYFLTAFVVQKVVKATLTPSEFTAY